MKISTCLGAAVLFLVASIAMAQNDQQPKPPASLMELFRVGDHIGYSSARDPSGFSLMIYGEDELRRALDYYANRVEFDKKRAALQKESRESRVRSSDDQATREKQKAADAELNKRIEQVSRPTSTSVGRVFAIGSDYIGLIQLETGSELFIPTQKIISVLRKRPSSTADPEKK